MTLPQCTIGWSAVCDCGISGSRSLPFYVESKYICKQRILHECSLVIELIKRVEE